MTDEAKALVERLRDYGDREDYEVHHDRIEAADHIEKLEADKALLREALEEFVDALVYENAMRVLGLQK